MENIQFIIKDYQISKLGIGNILKCLISALRVNKDTVIECYPDYRYGAYDTILDDKFIFKGKGTKELEKVYTCRLLILKDETYQQDIPTEEWYMGGLENPRFHPLFSFTQRIDWNYDASKVEEKVKQSLFQTIDTIRFTDVVYHEVNRITSTFRGPVLGISVRTWKAAHESNVPREYEFEKYRMKIKELLDRYPIETIVLSIDNMTFLSPYLEFLSDRNVVILDKSDRVNEIQHALIKALVLSHSSYFIGNRISTFTELVFWFGKCKPMVHPIG